MFGTGLVALPVVQDGSEAFLEVRDGSGGTSRGSRGVGNPFQRFGSAPNSLPAVWERSGGPPRGPERVGRPFWRSWMGGKPSGGPGWV